MPKLIPITFEAEIIGYRFWCPACRALHPLYTVKWADGPVWWFNGDLERPQFAPSLRMIQENNCHLYVSDGLLVYCNDCKHELRNQTIPMADFDLERWCPVSTLHTLNGKPVEKSTAPSPLPTVSLGNPTVTATAAVATLETHRANCGDVGIVGAVCPSCGVSLEK